MLPPDLSPPTRLEPTVGDQVPDPDDRAGARTQRGDEDDDAGRPPRQRRSLAERMKAVHDTSIKKADDVLDGIGEAVKTTQRGLSRPTGHAHIGTGTRATPPPVEHASVPDTVQAAFVAGAVIVEGVKWAVKRWRHRSEGKQ